MSWFTVGAISQPAQAQILPDNTLGTTPTTLRNEASTGQLLIEGGAPRGSTLFHSFSDFNIAPNGNAYFINPDSIDLIVSRITGNRASNLLGTLGILGEADLFFVNPNGIVFGPDSNLDVNGSFVASTADSVVFSDEFLFSAAAPETPPALTISTPTGLQFGQQPGTISYDAELAFSSQGLRVQPEKSLALLGGELDFQGANLSATGGRIELGSIADTSLVAVDSVAHGWTFNYDEIASFGDLTAASSFITTTIEDETLITSKQQLGEIVIQAADVTLSMSTFIIANTFTDLSAGNLTVNVQRLTLEDGSAISSRAVAFDAEDIQGNAGTIFINASEDIILRGGADFGSFISPTGISSGINGELTFFGFTFGAVTGNGGSITINTKRLSVLEGAIISTNTDTIGNAGDVTINATESINVAGVLSGENSFAPGLITTGNFGGSGSGGRLLINTDQLIVQDGGNVVANSIGSGFGGSIEINANAVEVLGSSPISNNPAINEVRSAITASAREQGDAGQIIVNAQRVNVQDGGEITTETLAGSSGNGNLLIVNATEDIHIAGVSAIEGAPSGFFSSTEGDGNAGLLQVNTDELRVEAGGLISAATLSDTARSSGGLDLQVNRLFLNNGSLTVDTRAQGGSGAEISISDLDVLLLRNGSLISAEAFNSANGGNVFIDATEGFVVAPFEEDSDILARANLGDGGNIEIVAQSILGLTAGLAIRGNGTNDIDASSGFGASGTVLLNELAVNPAVEEVELPDNTGAPEIAQQCNPSQDVSSFVVTGRGGVPLEPQAAVPEILWRPSSSNTQSSSSVAASGQIVEAQGWQTNAVGQIVLTASTTETVPYATTSSVVHCALVRSS